jgi:hypothetical protein
MKRAMKIVAIGIVGLYVGTIVWLEHEAWAAVIRSA